MTGPEPILASWKVSEVLRRYPQLLDVLINLSPAFGRLRNPILRRVQTRLVTVAQAARVAGMEPGTLVAALNASAGVAPAQAAPGGTAGPPLAPRWQGGDGEGPASTAPADQAFLDAPVAAELDARPLHARGEEPLSAIMAAAAGVPGGSILLLRNSFEPVPLYGVLARQGFAHQTRQLGPEDWEVRFLKTGKGRRERPATPEPPEASGEAPVPPSSTCDKPTATVTIDVSDLVPPEPMVRILGALEKVPPGGSLLVHHVRRPVYLYPQLEALGCTHETRDLASGLVEILIRKPAAR